MTIRTKSIAVVAALLLLPGVLTACASGGGTPGGAGASSDVADRASKLNAATACMRDKGYDLPDPTGGGQVEVAIPDGVDPAEYGKDFAACSKQVGLSTGTGQAKPIAMDPEEYAKYVACIRDHGFADFPDDDADAPSYQPNDQGLFAQAETECSDRAFGGQE